MTIHLVRAVASRLKRPTRTSVQDRTSRMRHVSLHGLAPDGVYLAQPVASLAVRSTAPFHPYQRAPHGASRRSVFCGTFPGVAPAGRYPAS